MKNAEINSRSGKKGRKLFRLDEEEMVFVCGHAAHQEASESAMIRQVVPKLQKDSGVDPFLKLIGMVAVGTGGSIRHDEIISE